MLTDYAAKCWDISQALSLPQRLNTSKVSWWGCFHLCGESCLVAPSEQDHGSHTVEHNIQTIAAGPSQCLIMDTLNDVVGFGLECIASKGLHGLNFELKERRKLSCGPK
eukprot:scaffold87071_cov43-Cyclotella_meneghiniana.AAC.1